MPLVPVLAAMEMRGIRIDEGFFAQLGEKFAGELEQVELMQAADNALYRAKQAGRNRVFRAEEAGLNPIETR